MTACATLIPTKANAIKFTFQPSGIVERNPNEFITFVASVDPEGSNTLRFIDLQIINPQIGTPFFYDKEELEVISVLPEKPFDILGIQPIATIEFRVLEGVKEDKTPDDFYSILAILYDSATKARVFPLSSGKVDVVPPQQLASVPEPLTMLGAAAALGYGAILKRESSKKRKANHYIE
jgi:hypothetical protein